MNKLQRIERIEAQRRRRVATVPNEIADAEQRVKAKLETIAARMRTNGQVPEEYTPTPEEEAHMQAMIARLKEEIQREAPKVERWLKLQGKQNRH